MQVCKLPDSYSCCAALQVATLTSAVQLEQEQQFLIAKKLQVTSWPEPHWLWHTEGSMHIESFTTRMNGDLHLLRK